MGGLLEKVIAQRSNSRSSRPKRGSVYHTPWARHDRRIAAGQQRLAFGVGDLAWAVQPYCKGAAAALALPLWEQSAASGSWSAD
jgi:hypothetical protein